MAVSHLGAMIYFNKIHQGQSLAAAFLCLLLCDKKVLKSHLNFIFLPTGSKLTSSERVAAAEKKEKRVSAEDNDKPQKPRE